MGMDDCGSCIYIISTMEPIGIKEQTMTWEDLLTLREKILSEQEELEAHLQIIKEEILLRLDEEKVQGKIVGSKNISVRTVYTTDKEIARELGAITTVTQERINTGVIKELYLKGIEIKNLQVNRIPLITEIRKEEKNG